MQQQRHIQQELLDLKSDSKTLKRVHPHVRSHTSMPDWQADNGDAASTVFCSAQYHCCTHKL